MKSNIILLSVGFIIVLIPLVLSFIVKEKKTNNSRVNYYEKQNEENIISDKISIMESKIIMEKMTKLELEVLELKKENSKIIEQYKKSNLPENKNILRDNNFKQALNYNVFKERNNDIIDLHRQGKSKEEIAKTLNKSIREIEMIINLLKWGEIFEKNFHI